MRITKMRGMRAAGLWRMALLAVPMVGMLVAGCAAAGGESAGQGTGMRSPTAAECAQVAAVQPPADARREVLLVDNTASQVRQGMPPAVTEQLQTAQKDGAVLIIMAVNGEGAAPRLVRATVLDPRRGHDSPDAQEARHIALQCVADWAYGPDAAATARGSDVAGALAAAVRQRPQKLLVVSDAVATAGAVDLRVLGYDADPKAVAAAARGADALPSFSSIDEVVWTGAGDTVRPLPESARSGLQRLWQALLREAGASRVTFDTRAASGPGPSGHRLRVPGDPIPVPHSIRITLPHGETCFRLPAALLFAGDSSRPAADAARQLTPLVEQLAQHEGWVATLSGHTADYGTPAGRLRLSQARAEAIAGLLRSLGMSPGRISTVGYGATRPLMPEWHHGIHDVAAAAANRRVEALLHPVGSSPPAVCPATN
ncbi:OmpA family protein [Streptomyces populi]